MKKFAIILSGCGVYDGSEIHETVLTMLAIDQSKASYQIFAPDIDHTHVVNHLTGEEMKETRNVLTESARIARGNALPLSDLKVKDFNALIFPGVFLAAKNLSTYAFEGKTFKVNPQVEKVVREAIENKTLIGALCISPVILARIIENVRLTIGNDPATNENLKEMGVETVDTTHGEIVVDEKNKVYSTPCYMLESSISQIADGANNLIKKMMNDLND
jgi:enhancing lycopene biosynthesis protein 2